MAKMDIRPKKKPIRKDAKPTKLGKEVMHQKVNRLARGLEKEYINSARAEVIRQKINELHLMLELPEKQLKNLV
jgi:hypothetical protein